MSTIRAAAFRRVSVPLSTPYREAIAEVGAFHHVIATLEVDGHTGVGEADFLNVTPNAAPVVADALERLVAPRLVGRDVHDVEGAVALTARLLGDALTPVALHGAMAAVDLALHDLRGRLLGLPVHRVLGGAAEGPIPVSFTLSAAAPSEMAAAAAERASAGYRTLVIKAGRGGIDADAQRVAAVREAVGEDVRLRVDVNGGYRDVAEAIAAIRGFADQDVELVEQPLPRGDVADLAELRRAVDVPLCADESLVTLADAHALASAGAVDVFNVKVTKCGGLLTSLRIAAVAEAAGIPVIVGGHPTQEIARQACRHFAVATRAVDLTRAHEGPGPASQALVEHLTREVVTPEDVERLGGVVEVPTAPGLGVELIDEAVERYAV